MKLKKNTNRKTIYLTKQKTKKIKRSKNNIFVCKKNIKGCQHLISTAIDNPTILPLITNENTSSYKSLTEMTHLII